MMSAAAWVGGDMGQQQHLLQKCMDFWGYGQYPAVSRWFADEPESQFSAFAFRGGVVSLLWHSLGSPLPVRLAAPVQLAHLLLYMLQLAPAVCSNIIDVRDGRATVDWADGIITWMRVELLGGSNSSSSSSISSSSSNSNSNSGSSSGAGGASADADVVYAACINYQLALQSVLGFVLPCVLQTSARQLHATSGLPAISSSRSSRGRGC
ncbi:hypothetical protein OEZ85_004832 [Tetradesmus obliquus]|uniref:Uncharacterized protein n=1 Tax=Tetradesmus obliquus TaxID=3088 RepID=A0ABY8UJQ1_TETOB|nr:hypothetical protein OEZ85_004832 [Tetradesmus obliquus]